VKLSEYTSLVLKPIIKQKPGHNETRNNFEFELKTFEIKELSIIGPQGNVIYLLSLTC